jgi:hypothetical protein
VSKLKTGKHKIKKENFIEIIFYLFRPLINSSADTGKYSEFDAGSLITLLSSVCIG